MAYRADASVFNTPGVFEDWRGTRYLAVLNTWTPGYTVSKLTISLVADGSGFRIEWYCLLNDGSLVFLGDMPLSTGTKTFGVDNPTAINAAISAGTFKGLAGTMYGFGRYSDSIKFTRIIFEPDALRDWSKYENGFEYPVLIQGAAADAILGNDNSATLDALSPALIDYLNPGQPVSNDIRAEVTETEGMVAAGNRDSYIEYVYNAGTSQPNSYSVWFKTDGTLADPSGATLYRHHRTAAFDGDAYHNRLVLLNSWQINGASVPNVASEPYTDNQWHHAVVTRSGTLSTLYLDGMAVGSATTATSWVSTGPLLLGTGYPGTDKYSPATSGFPFTGNLDDLSVYARALNDAEVSRLYAAGRQNAYVPIEKVALDD